MDINAEKYLSSFYYQIPANIFNSLTEMWKLTNQFLSLKKAENAR